MISDLDILRCANLMVRTHGEEAVEFARERIGDMEMKGDPEGRRVWIRITAAVAGLLGRPLQVERLH
jgi:hypothetical protein